MTRCAISSPWMISLISVLWISERGSKRTDEQRLPVDHRVFACRRPVEVLNNSSRTLRRVRSTELSS
jgi:hypothetical protein